MKLQHRIILLIILTLCSSSIKTVQAQEEKKMGLVLSPIFSLYSVYDQHASPVHYQLNAPAIRLGYEVESAKAYSLYYVQYGNGKFRPKNGDLNYLTEDVGWASRAIDLRAQHLRKLKSTDKEMHLLGPVFQYDFKLDFDYLGNWPWAFGQAALGVSYQYRRALGTGKLHAGIHLPLVALITRLPYSNIPRTQGQVPGVASLFQQGSSINTLDKYQRVDLFIAYNKSIGEKWDIRPSYQFYWLRFSEPDVVQAYDQQLAVQFIRNF